PGARPPRSPSERRSACAGRERIRSRRRVAGHIISKQGPTAARAMTVNLTRIYTRLGDGGETHLGDMSRVSKLHPRVEAYGTVDELNATIGVALLAPDMPKGFAQWLRRVQNDLLDVGADLSVPPPNGEAAEAGARPRPRVDASYAEWLA